MNYREVAASNLHKRFFKFEESAAIRSICHVSKCLFCCSLAIQIDLACSREIKKKKKERKKKAAHQRETKRTGLRREDRFLQREASVSEPAAE